MRTNNESNTTKDKIALKCNQGMTVALAGLAYGPHIGVALAEPSQLRTKSPVRIFPPELLYGVRDLGARREKI